MNGYQYEQQCAKLLKKKGFYNITITKGSGDQGIDIIAYRNHKKYGIQCKYYSYPIGNSAVQEAFAGAKYYKCDIPVVMTNNTFTKSAIDLSSKTGVILWEQNNIPFPTCLGITGFFRLSLKSILNTTAKAISSQEHIRNDIILADGFFDEDEFLIDAAIHIIKSNKASIAMLQREFSIGFNRGAKIMDTLYSYGIVSEENGTNPRKILMTMEQFEDFLKEGDQTLKKNQYSISQDRLKEIAVFIQNLYQSFGISITVTDISVENDNVIFYIVPEQGVCVKKIISYKQEVSMVIGTDCDIKLIAEKGCIGIFVLMQYFINK